MKFSLSDTYFLIYEEKFVISFRQIGLLLLLPIGSRFHRLLRL